MKHVGRFSSCGGGVKLMLLVLTLFAFGLLVDKNTRFSQLYRRFDLISTSGLSEWKNYDAADMTSLSVEQNGEPRRGDVYTNEGQQEDEATERTRDIDYLTEILNSKLSAINGSSSASFKPTCHKKFTLANSCDNGACLQKDLPSDVRTRVRQLVGPRELQLTSEQREILRGIAGEVKGYYDIIILTGASSNHYNESQAMLMTVHERLFPILKNFTLIYFNLGLTADERRMVVKNCKCQVIDFPFRKFPDFIQELRCYSWKPVMIKSVLQRTNILIWMDASIRLFENAANIKTVIENARDRGIQIGGSNVISAFRTFRSMYHFFGDEPCAYFDLKMTKCSFGIYRNEVFVHRLILEPWVACALNAQCMCPPDRFNGTCRQSKDMNKLWLENNGPIAYGLCHLYDQSLISLILHKVYLEKYQWAFCNINSFGKIMRDDLASYFS
ncbi:unnamed protein product [Lymnaea stagnalis]|uniref:Uncharacterized protein n=1 Tax=Lymnaea stagnalis TaxID=6523 RepID=A0AAV2IGQ5_LYMST